MLSNLAAQTVRPSEVILVDGAGPEDERTRETVAAVTASLSCPCRYLRRSGGPAIQRNVGIDASDGDFIAFLDDDIRLADDFFEQMLVAFEDDLEKEVGGIAGYVTNQFLDPKTSPRWRLYRRLRLFSTFEPGRYDFQSGYPINRYLQPPHEDLKEIDFMGAGCAVWRREVFASGLRFADFFTGYSVLEDAHFALRAGRSWRLLENGRARCLHLRSPRTRAGSRRIGRQSAVNYRYVFIDLVPERTPSQELRFWRVQLLDLLRFWVALLRRRDRESLALIVGKLEGIWQAARMKSHRGDGRRRPC